MNVLREQWNEQAEDWGNLVRDNASYSRHLQATVDLRVKQVPRRRSLDVRCGPGLPSVDDLEVAGAFQWRA
jgi:hypothetical protein